MTSIIEEAEASYHKPVILHCAFCVIMTRFFSNCITITIINIIIMITIITRITITTHITII